jgi:hypothetical protein
MCWHRTIISERGTAFGLTLVVLAIGGLGCDTATYSRGKDGGGTGGSPDGTGGNGPLGTGGNPVASGGAGAEPVSSGGAGVGTGGAAIGAGGSVNTGGRPATGGTTGGGGAAGSGRGGTPGSSGGASAATGGRGTGGAASGGSSSGGRGGANTGGAATGGANTGGAATGGANTGGANTGGANTGGANTGGASTGGMGTGGAATGGMGTGGAAAPTGAILYYPFDETTGTSVADQSGNARNGTVAGGGAFAPAVVRNGLTLAGGTTTATQTYVSIPAGLLTAVRDMTVSLWVKVTAERNWQRIFDFGNSTTTGYMFLTSRGLSTNTRFAITATDRFAEQYVDAPALPMGTWKHVALVLGTAGASLYIDGVKAGTNAALTLRPADLSTITNHWLGRSHYTADQYFSGQIDELRIYARALSDAEVAQLFTLR